MCAIHMMGESSRKKVVSTAMPTRNRKVPPNRRRRVGRLSTSTIVATFGANHMTRIAASSATP